MEKVKKFGKKLWIVLAAAAVAAGAFLLTACGPHDHDYKSKVVAPTCIDQGYTHYRCEICGYEYNDKFVEATGIHSYVDYVCEWCGKIADDAPYTQNLIYYSIESSYGDVIGYGVANGSEGLRNVTYIKIPATHEGKPVLEIARKGFGGNIKGVSIPDSVTEIGAEAFYNCDSLLGVEFGNGLVSIGDSAFRDCEELKSIEIPNSVTSIEEYAFYNCRNVRSLTIGDSVTSIGDYAFSGCYKLTRLDIPKSLTSIGEDAFKGDACSLTSITVQSGNDRYYSAGNCLIDERSKTLILGCKNSEIPSAGSVTVIGDGAFASCVDLTSIIIPTGVTRIGYSAFSNCIKLTSVEMPSGVTNIDDCAFENCSKLKKAEIPNGVTSIGRQAFYMCVELQGVRIPASVTSVGSDAFNFCYKTEKREGDVDYVDKWAVWCSDYKKSFSLRADTVGIVDEAFNNRSHMTEIKIPDGLKYIGRNAFYGCKSLSKVEIPSSVESIGEHAFELCSENITSVTVKEGNERYHSTGNCLIETSSKTLMLGCKNSVIPDDGSVTSIGYAAFYGCSGLTGISIPNTVTSIGSNAFNGCSGLTSISIPSSVTSIEGFAFFGCDKLIQLENMVYYVDKWAIEGSTLLTSVALRSDTVGIANGAFRSCGKMTEIEMPSTISNIGQYAFNGCYALSKIKYNGKIERWNAIVKAATWNNGTGNFTVACTDGTITKNGSEIIVN